MGEGTDAARAKVLTARGAVEDELERLEAAARAAVDVKAKVRRNPGKTAGLAAGAGFLLLGGPRKVLRGTRRVILGKPNPLPESMLPDDIERALKALGGDGERVRGTIEREFADYLRKHEPERRRRDFSGTAALLLASIARPVLDRYGRRMIEALANPDPRTFAEKLELVRARTRGAAGTASTSPGAAPAPDAASGPPAPSA